MRQEPKGAALRAAALPGRSALRDEWATYGPVPTRPLWRRTARPYDAERPALLAARNGSTCASTSLDLVQPPAWSASETEKKLARACPARSRIGACQGSVVPQYERVSRRMLTLSLRNLERNGLVTRTVYPDPPPRVEYATTALVEEIREPLEALAAWAGRSRPAIAAARICVRHPALRPRSPSRSVSRSVGVAADKSYIVDVAATHRRRC